MTLVELTQKVNDLSARARANKLKPADLEGGTFTISNIGGFGNLMGTPIIVQPQVGILAFGVIEKKPAVITNDKGEDVHCDFVRRCSYPIRMITEWWMVR